MFSRSDTRLLCVVKAVSKAGYWVSYITTPLKSNNCLLYARVGSREGCCGTRLSIAAVYNRILDQQRRSGGNQLTKGR